MALRLITPIVLIIISIIWFFASLMLPRAPLGNPNGPIYFPMLLSVFLFIMSVIYFFQEWKKEHKEESIFTILKSGRTPQLIIGTLILCILYTFIFERIGFLFSTILFMIALLFLINGYRGWKKWVTNLAVAVIFPFLLWYGFVELLGLSLP